jgi:hypothetical protein
MRVSALLLILWLVVVSVLELLAGFTPIPWMSWSRKEVVAYGMVLLVVVVWALVRREHR